MSVVVVFIHQVHITYGDRQLLHLICMSYLWRRMLFYDLMYCYIHLTAFFPGRAG